MQRVILQKVNKKNCFQSIELNCYDLSKFLRSFTSMHLNLISKKSTCQVYIFIFWSIIYWKESLGYYFKDIQSIHLSTLNANHEALTYKNNTNYNQYTYFDIEIEMCKYRLAQPSSKGRLIHTLWTSTRKSTL
jgi:hypothetical protein